MGGANLVEKLSGWSQLGGETKWVELTWWGHCAWSSDELFFITCSTM